MSNHKFLDLDLSPEILRACEKLHLTVPTSVQREAIPPMMQGYNLIAKAPTGTGKTFAYGIPILEYIQMDYDFVQDLVLCPTRELAQQISTELRSIGQFIQNLKVVSVIGGQNLERQANDLRMKPQIVVATPGRLLDHVARGNIDISKVYSVILDEADEMLSMGFIKEIRRILDLTPADRQVALFSATMSREVMDLNWQYLQGAVNIDVAPKAEDMPKIKQFKLSVSEKDKLDMVLKIIRQKKHRKIIVFCNTKTRVRHVTERLQRAGITADCLHGDINQNMRNRIMEGYRKGKFPVLIATDVAARGIDVADIDGVFNYDVPKENEYYLHRIGRTGRAQKDGAAYTLVSYMEEDRMDEILRYTKAEVESMEWTD